MTNTKANLESLFNDIEERSVNGSVLVAKQGEIYTKELSVMLICQQIVH